MPLARPPHLPAWAWLLLAVWGPGVQVIVGASGYRPPLSFARTLLFGLLDSAWAYLALVALRRLLASAAARRPAPYVVRHAGLIFGASVGAAQLAEQVPLAGDVPLLHSLAAVLLHGTIGAPFALWGGALWQAAMHWFLPIDQRPSDP